MVDWHRMEWQFKANIWASRCLVLFVLLNAAEVREAFVYHFPWWDDVAACVTIPLTWVCWFVRKHTMMYRIDL
jgi:hypothetical protein